MPRRELSYVFFLEWHPYNKQLKFVSSSFRFNFVERSWLEHIFGYVFGTEHKSFSSSFQVSEHRFPSGKRTQKLHHPFCIRSNKVLHMDYGISHSFILLAYSVTVRCLAHPALARVISERSSVLVSLWLHLCGIYLRGSWTLPLQLRHFQLQLCQPLGK